MNIKAKILTGAVALAVGASTVLAATNASAYPRDNDRYDSQYNNRTQQDRGRNDNDRGRYDNNRNRRGNDQPYRDQSQYNKNIYNRTYNLNQNQYPERFQGSLPSGFRRVVYRNRPYYVRDNHYYSYDSNSRAFINVRLPFINIHL
jgi:hypothetical protein